MRGYAGIHMPLSASVHFVRNSEIDDGMDAIVGDVKRQSMLIGYVDYNEVKDSTDLVNALGKVLRAPHTPYGERMRYVQFLDDLIALSFRESGLLIVVDNADVLIKKNINGMFDLTESFLIQSDKWFEKGKPCHLCFQVEPNEAIRGYFAS